MSLALSNKPQQLARAPFPTVHDVVLRVPFHTEHDVVLRVPFHTEHDPTALRRISDA